ncbi:MAG TPA: hypothetical protein VI758_01595 [Bacteroidota bacterium]
MNGGNMYGSLVSIRWQWLLVSFCSLVLYHLLPSYILLSPQPFLGFRRMWTIAAWLVVGIAAVSYYVSQRSSKPTIVEPAIASTLYSLLMIVYLPAPESAPVYYRHLSFLPVPLILSFVTAFTSAGIGVWLKARKTTLGLDT